MMGAATTMTRDEAANLLKIVPYLERLEVGMLMNRGAALAVPVRSYEEYVKVAEALTPVVSAEKLSKWVEKSFGDDELAALVRESCADVPLFKQAGVVLPLVKERLAQAHEAMGDTSAAEATTV